MTQHSDRLWGGRFKTGPSAALTALSRSDPSFFRLAPYDLAGSRAHAQELRRAEILTADELQQLLSEMDRLEAQFLAGEVGPTLDDEDVHTFLERELTQRLGATGGKLRAGRSRNLATNSLAVSGHSAASTGAAVTTSLETMVPLSAFAKFEPGHTPLSVNHQGQFAATTISFNLAPGRSLSEAKTEIDNAIERIGMPSTVRGSFAGTAATFQQSQSSMPLLFGAALVTIYIVLGVLYESLIHPLTILSTLFSASVGAALALWLFDTQFTIIAAIGVLLLIGIVKKNAIMMVDFALEAERQGRDTREAIEEACLLRFRPIMMTTFAALFGALPLAFGTGEGSELRHPLGITIVGGLIVSQALTLYTTPVVFIYLDDFGKWLSGLWRRYYLRHGAAPIAGAAE